METDPVYLYRTGKLILYLPHAEHKGLSKQESYDSNLVKCQEENKKDFLEKG